MPVENITIVRDDLTGEEGASLRYFSVGKQHYRIYLTDESWSGFLNAVSTYTAVAEPDRRRNVSPEEVALRGEIRDWAKKQGLKVGERGRIPMSIVQAYKDSNQSVGAGR